MSSLNKAFALAAFVLAAAGLFLVSGIEHALAFLAPAQPLPLMHRQAGYMEIDVQPFSNVVAGGKATSTLDSLIGYTVDRIILELGGTFTKAQIDNLRLYANEKVIFEDSGSRIDGRNQYRGMAASAAYLTLDFSEIRSRTIIGQHAGSIDTVSAGIRKLQLAVDINAAAVGPTLSAYAMLSQGGQKDPAYNKLIAKSLNRTWNPGGAGEFAMDFSYAKVPGSYVKRVHLFGATVTAARVKKNGIEIFKATTARNSFVVTEFQRVPQANVFTIDFMVDGNISEALPLENAQSLEWLVTTSGAGNIVAVTEILDLLDNN